MKIERDTEMKDEVMAAIKELLTRNDDVRMESIHVSDLLFPLKSYFKRVDPRPLEERDMLQFIGGRGHGSILEALINRDELSREVGEKVLDVDATIDVLKNLQGTKAPVEIKTTRTFKMYDVHEVPEWYLKQLGYYCAAYYKDKKEGVGYLLIFYLAVDTTIQLKGGGTKRAKPPKLDVFKITWDDLDKVRETLKAEAKVFQDAIDRKDPKYLQKCPAWMCPTCTYYRDPCGGAV